MAIRKPLPKITRYPFVVSRNKAIVINATTLDNAIGKALMKYPNKFITTTYAKAVETYITRLNEKDRVKVVKLKNGSTSGSLVTDDDIIEDIIPNIKTKLKHKLFMDLQEARKKAALKSKGDKYAYVNVKPAGDPDEGDCFISDKPDATTYAAFKNGSEIAVPVKSEKTKEKTAKQKAETVTEATGDNASTKQTNKVMAKTANKKASAKKAAAKKGSSTKKETKVVAAPKGKKNVSIKEIISLIKKGTKVYNHADKSLTLGYMEKMKDHSRSMPVSY